MNWIWWLNPPTSFIRRPHPHAKSNKLSLWRNLLSFQRHDDWLDKVLRRRPRNWCGCHYCSWDSRPKSSSRRHWPPCCPPSRWRAGGGRKNPQTGGVEWLQTHTETAVCLAGPECSCGRAPALYQWAGVKKPSRLAHEDGFGTPFWNRVSIVSAGSKLAGLFC